MQKIILLTFVVLSFFAAPKITFAWQGSFKSLSVEELIKLVETGTNKEKLNAIRALADRGPAAKEAIPALLKALKNDKDTAVRYNAGFYIGKFKDPSVLPVLIEVAQREIPIVRMGAIIGIADFGEKANDAIPTLVNALKDKDEGVREKAADAIGSIKWIGHLCKNSKDREKCLKDLPPDPDFELIMPALIEASQDADEDVRGCVLNTLGAIGASSPAALQVFIKSLKDPSATVRWKTAQAISNLGLKAIPAIPELIEGLKDQDKSMIMHSAQTLGGIALFSEKQIPELKEALPLLHEVINDREKFGNNDFNRKILEQTINRIEENSKK